MNHPRVIFAVILGALLWSWIIATLVIEVTGA